MKKNINFKRLVFEFISISFAIIVALLVNQWKSDYNNSKMAKKSIYNIREELKENQDVMTKLIPNHKLVLTSIDSLIRVYERDQSIADSIATIEVTLINSSAWEMAKITNAVYYIDFDYVNNLAKVYNLQTYYESIVKQYILNNSFDSQNSDLQGLTKTKAFLNTIIPLEKDLAYYYELMLNEIKTD